MLPTPVLPAPVAQVLDAVNALGQAANPSNQPVSDSDTPSCAATSNSTAVASGHRPTASPPLDASERAAWLVGLRQIIDTAEAAFTTVLADFDIAGDGQRLHAASTTQAWLRGALGMASGEASERVRMARSLRAELAPALNALSSVAPMADPGADPGVDPGPDPAADPKADSADDIESDLYEASRPEAASPGISYEHVRAIHRALRTLPPSSRSEAAGALTNLAHQLSVDDLRAAAKHLKNVIDPDGALRHAEEDFERRWLSIAPLLDGMFSIDGVLDAETSAALNTALAPFLVPVGSDDYRRPEQRRADGLAELVTIAVRSGELPTLSGTSASLQVDVPLSTLTGQTPHPARLAGPSATPTWLTPMAAERLSCDASVRRLLLDPSGIPLDLGREVRVFTSAQRKALAVRDTRCRFPGCSRPSLHTDAHHLVPWARGGATDLSNGLLLCRYHHRKVHEGGWRIVPIDTDRGANGPLSFRGPDRQWLQSPIPTARGLSP